MNLLILASHGQLAQGMKKTLQMIIGEVDNLHAFSAFRDDDQSIKEKVQQLIEENTEKDIYILTDILGGSVNTEMIQLLKEYPQVHLLAGINLPLVLLFASQSKKITEEQINDFISESQTAIVNCSKIIKEKQLKEEEL